MSAGAVMPISDNVERVTRLLCSLGVIRLGRVIARAGGGLGREGGGGSVEC